MPHLSAVAQRAFDSELVQQMRDADVHALSAHLGADKRELEASLDGHTPFDAVDLVMGADYLGVDPPLDLLDTA